MENPSSVRDVQLQKDGLSGLMLIFDRLLEASMPEIKDKTDRYLLLACGVALTSDARMKHGAVVFKHGKVIGVSPNRVKNDPRYVDWKHSSVHAELAAMRRAGWPKKATVYVARVNRHGVQRNSKPCIKCQDMLDAFNCRVYWTEDDGNTSMGKDENA